MQIIQEHAAKLIAAAIGLTSKEFVASLVNSTELSTVETPAPKEKRGRKPGAAPDGERCTWTNGDKQCKNKHVNGTNCTRHAKMTAVLTSASDAVSS